MIQRLGIGLLSTTCVRFFVAAAAAARYEAAAAMIRSALSVLEPSIRIYPTQFVDPAEKQLGILKRPKFARKWKL
jgi:hypothetical protein